VSVVAALIWLTWYKTTEVVREVVDFQTMLDQDGENNPSGRKGQLKLDKIGLSNNIGFKDGTNKKDENIVKVMDFSTTDAASSVTTTTTKKTTTTTTTTTTAAASTTTTTTTEVTTSAPPQADKQISTTQSQTTTKATAEEIHVHGVTQTAEKRHVAFLKVHKTGSSTVQNIFLRFGDSRNLTFILAHDDVSLAESKFPNMISYQNSLTEKNVVPPPAGRHFEILCCHVIYNRTQFQKFLPKDTAYIGLVRDPITRLESSFRYFNMYPTAKLSDFAANPFHYDKGLHSMSNNRMAFEFGFPLCLFPNSKEKPENLQQAIEEYITKLMTEFDLIMINERMDESLVLLKRVLNWHTKDIMYMKQLVAKHETRRFVEGDIKNLKAHLYLDFALYQRALSEFLNRVEALGEDFQEEVNLFSDEKEKVHNFCSHREKEILSFPDSKWDSAFNITREDCFMYTRFEIKFIQDIRMKMYGKLGI
jgi:hypothetical protein